MRNLTLSAVVFLFCLSTYAESVSILSFNVENLFDTLDDKDRSDESFLPLETKIQNDSIIQSCLRVRRFKWKKQCLYLDWSEENLKAKMTNIEKVVRASNKGKGPDIIVFQEVENLRVLTQLRDQHLKEWKHIGFIEGFDKRGIDIAVLSKKPLQGKPQLHKIPFKKMKKGRVKDTRGILQVEFQLDDHTRLVIFGVHLPAPYHPYHFRIQAVEFLNSLVGKLDKKDIAVAIGDFNIPRDEEEKRKILRGRIDQYWQAPHLEYCKDCKGTTYYPPKKSWSFLDLALVSKSQGKWSFDPKSFRVENGLNLQKTPESYPKSFDPKTQSGVSDHFPILLELQKS